MTEFHYDVILACTNFRKAGFGKQAIPRGSTALLSEGWREEPQFTFLLLKPSCKNVKIRVAK